VLDRVRQMPVPRSERMRPAAAAQSVEVGAGAGDHRRVQVEAGHLEPVVAGQPDRQVAGPTADLQDPGAVGGARRDIGGDALDQRPEQEPAQGVVDDRIASSLSPRCAAVRAG
jgi:hypothetical protein